MSSKIFKKVAQTEMNLKFSGLFISRWSE